MMSSLRRYATHMAMIILLGGAFITPATAQEETPAASVTAQEEAVAEQPAPAQRERAGTVDGVQDKYLIINDSTVMLTDSILLYDQGGSRMSGNEFRVGDKVEMTLVEDAAAGKWKIVSITRTKGASEETHSTVQQTTAKPGQNIRKVNGVWIND
jgi:hypothetical protein